MNERARRIVETMGVQYSWMSIEPERTHTRLRKVPSIINACIRDENYNTGSEQ